MEKTIVLKISKKQLLILLFAIFLSVRAVGIAEAYPIQWTIGSGGNGHWYDSVALINEVDNDDVTWEQANQLANATTFERMSGYLATLTSAAENEWVWKTFGWSSTFWLGGYQDKGTITSNENWHWVTGELWGYTNWGYDSYNVEDEPNDNGPTMNGIKIGEDKLHFYYNNGTWNDISSIDRYNGYIVEFSHAPEPATMLMLGLGLMGLAIVRRKVKKN